MRRARQLKRATIKEELVALTGDAIDALILNHMIKCQASARQIERYIEEERARFAAGDKPLHVTPTEGWFYKKAEEVSEETMLGLSKSNMRARLVKLVQAGWVEERDNPVIKWDKTKQFRVDLLRIEGDLQRLGYYLDGWLIEQITESGEKSPQLKHRGPKLELRDSKTELRSSEEQLPDSEMTLSEFSDETAITSSTPSQYIQEYQQHAGQNGVVDAISSTTDPFDSLWTTLDARTQSLLDLRARALPISDLREARRQVFNEMLRGTGAPQSKPRQ